MTYKFLPHTADLKFQAEATSLEEAFSESALALKEAISRKIQVKEEISKKVLIEGTDLQNLLYNFLEEFLFLLDSENFLFSKIEKIKIQKNPKGFKLEAVALGDKSEKYKFSNNVKAITYNDMLVQKGNNWKIQAVLDV